MRKIPCPTQKIPCEGGKNSLLDSMELRVSNALQ